MGILSAIGLSGYKMTGFSRLENAHLCTHFSSDMVLFTSRVAFITSLALIARGSPIGDEVSSSIRSVQITRPSINTEMKYFLPKERNRVNSFSEAAVAGNVPVTNVESSYYVTVGVGSQTFPRMIVDTGSSNTWVGASTRYTGSGSCSGTFSVTYGSGSVKGKECTDKVTVGGSSVPRQSFGFASSSSGFDGVDGYASSRLYAISLTFIVT